MNCGYVKTAWFPLSYVIIVIIIYSFTMFHYCSYYGRYSCYHFDYYCYIYIYAHIIATLHGFFPGFPLTSTWIQRPAGHFSGQAKSLVGIEEASHTGEWWMVGGCISNPGMVGEWLVNGWWMDPLKLGNHLPGHLPDMSGHASGCLLWVHPHILPGPSKHRDFPIDQSQTEIGNAVFLIKLAVRICTLQYCHTCFFSCFLLRPGQVAGWNTGAEGGLDDWLFWHQWLYPPVI